jgi:hypothetical protein
MIDELIKDSDRFGEILQNGHNSKKKYTQLKTDNPLK